MRPEHTDLAIHVAQYLHAQGLTQDPLAEQIDGGLPAVYIGGFPAQDDIDRAVAIIGPWQNNDDSKDSTVARFLVAIRSEPWSFQQLSDDCGTVHHALDRTEANFNLTAGQEVFYSERVLSDPPAQDTNRRWIRVDTYSSRLQPKS